MLALLEKEPAHGYELIKSLEVLSDGFYIPSPGMIYPALTYLEELGYATVDVEGTKKRYSLTPEGSTFLSANRETAERILSDLAQIGTRMADARRAFAGELVSEDETSGPESPLRRVRNELKGVIRGYVPTSPEDEARVAAILARAAAQVKGAGPAMDAPALLEAIKHRRSMGLSRLKPDEIERTIIERLLEAANWGQSHEDTEPWRFTVFSGEGRQKLADLFAEAKGDEARKRAFAAPVWISIGMSPKLNEDGSLVMSEEEELMAVATAVQNLHLMASAFGLAGMWHSKGLSIDPTVAKGLGLDAPSKLLGFFFCGWPNSEWPSGERGALSEKVRWVTED